jgi:hypothetical protein
MLRASPDFDDVDPLRRRTSVDLQEAMSMHFDESSSFDLLKDKILFPENDSLDGDLDLDLGSAPATKVLDDADRAEVIVMPVADADAESENEMDCMGMLEERLRDINLVEDQNKDGDRDTVISTPPTQFGNCNTPSQLLFLLMFDLDLSYKNFLQPRRHRYASSSAQRTRRCKFLPRPPSLITHLLRRSFLDDGACAHRSHLYLPSLRRHRWLNRLQKRKSRNRERR